MVHTYVYIYDMCLKICFSAFGTSGFRASGALDSNPPSNRLHFLGGLVGADEKNENGRKRQGCGLWQQRLLIVAAENI